jgi:Zn-dependent M16 (insulinase) family peptidase
MLILSVLAVTANAAEDVKLDKLTKGQAVDGFRVEAVYLNDSDKPLGARFVHKRTGFTLDLLQIESVPQGYTWVNSFPVSDQGEPHTQEHLLLGKGTTGRAFAGLDTMWLSGSSAFTQQWRTSYHFNTAGGPDVFFNLFGRQLDAMLHPNYTDEEIRREVRNFGVTENPDHTLRLEEKGSVYNEMVSSTGNPFRQLFRAVDHLQYGEQHPLAYNSGGEPTGIRTMKPEDIRAFHKSNYYLANMGLIASFPKSVAVDTILTRVDAILDKVQPNDEKRAAKTQADLPKPAGAPAGSIRIAEYPQRNEQQPSPIAIAWPANRDVEPNEFLLLSLFLDNIASDATSNLYKMFVDSKTRTMDIGAKSVFNNISSDQGMPVYIGMQDVNPSNFTDEKLSAIRAAVTGEIDRIAALPDGSPELKDFNDRIHSRLVELQRDLAKFVNTPPGFGFRNARSAWMDHLLSLERTSDFRKSVTLKPQVAYAEKQLASGKNVWKDYLAKWKITGVTPYVAAARPSPQLNQREEAERIARGNAEAARLAQAYGITDAQEAIKRYRTEYDAESARIEEEAKKIARPEFVKSPPMTMDDQLSYAVTRVGNGMPLVTSTFDNMTSAQLGIALRLDSVPADQLRYVSLLPVLLTRVGVIENGKPVSYEEMTDRLRKEILSLDPSFSTNQRTNRVELVVRGSGIGSAEASRAIDWMTLVLQHPDWRPENLPRIRDAVDQSLSALRNQMQGAEEGWVNNPAVAYRMQTNPAYLAADSFLTRSHNALRLRWLLKEAPAADRDALAAWFTDLAGKGTSRADVKKLIAAGAPDTLSPAAKAIAADALKDLDLTLIEIPDSSLAADWAQVANEMRSDLLTPPATALAALDAVRQNVLHAGNARLFLVGSTANQKALQPKIAALAASLSSEPVTRQSYGSARLIEERLRGRDATATNPVHVGLLAPNMKGGVITTTVPSVTYADADDKEKQLDYLASRLHAGYGAHGIFLKTIGAGLAYSNGLRASVTAGRMGYYAERTPELPQTVRFVVNELKNAPRDPSLGDYAVAQVFNEFRSAATYENRAEGMAADLADNLTPDQVRKFRQSILELRKDPNLGAKLFDRKDAVYARFIPGYDPAVKASSIPGGVFMVIGPDRQLDLYSEYLKTSDPDARLYKLYPRDFWLP